MSNEHIEGQVVEEVFIPAREGRGVRLDVGDILEIVDVDGRQVADLVAYVQPGRDEYLSPAHTVSCNASVNLGLGATLFSNHRDPVFTILRDDVARHDLVVPCCDQERYERDYGLADHPHCLGNLQAAADLLSEEVDLHGEHAWNIFMNNRITDAGGIVMDRPEHDAGSTIVLRAEKSMLVLVSACPQDLTPANDFNPTPIVLRVERSPKD